MRSLLRSRVTLAALAAAVLVALGAVLLARSLGAPKWGELALAGQSFVLVLVTAALLAAQRSARDLRLRVDRVGRTVGRSVDAAMAAASAASAPDDPAPEPSGRAVSDEPGPLDDLLATLGRERVAAEAWRASSTADLVHELAAMRESLEPRLQAQLAATDARLAGAVQEVGSQLGAQLGDQLEALLDLRALVPVPRAMPSLRTAPAGPALVRLAVQQVLDTGPRMVVACGVGTSALWLGHALRRRGHGRLVALEHETDVQESVRSLVAEHGLDDVVDVRLAPVTTVRAGGEDVHWYDPAAVQDLQDIDLVVVVPATGGPAVYPAVPLLFARAAAEVVVDLDSRADGTVTERWLAEHPALQRRQTAPGGVHVLARRAA